MGDQTTTKQKELLKKHGLPVGAFSVGGNPNEITVTLLVGKKDPIYTFRYTIESSMTDKQVKTAFVKACNEAIKALK